MGLDDRHIRHTAGQLADGRLTDEQRRRRHELLEQLDQLYWRENAMKRLRHQVEDELRSLVDSAQVAAVCLFVGGAAGLIAVAG
jgi:anti-sigma factor RsiW